MFNSKTNNLPLDDCDTEDDDAGPDTDAELGACEDETELGCPALVTWDTPAASDNINEINSTE